MTSIRPALYCAFDVFPSAKGAAVHIDRFARQLFDRAGGGILYVLGDGRLAPRQVEGPVEILRFTQSEPNLLARALAFGRALERLLAARGAGLRLAHFRDPWGGMAVLDGVPPGCRTLYEVNGLPSIELPFAYPGLPASTIDKLRAAELSCLDRADRVVTPSRTIAENLKALGADPAKIRVIPNGADPCPPESPPAPAPWPYLLYFGALQPWQGLETLLRAFARLLDLRDLHLAVCCSNSPNKAKPYLRLARHLGLGDRLHWEFRLSQAALEPWRRHALVSVAPLSECARNLQQGCAPLKILESMAAGVPVVASDLPAVREILEDGVHGRLVAPDRPAELARALRILLEYPEVRVAMGQQARRHLGDNLAWGHSLDLLDRVYLELGLGGGLDPDRNGTEPKSMDANG